MEETIEEGTSAGSFSPSRAREGGDLAVDPRQQERARSRHEEVGGNAVGDRSPFAGARSFDIIRLSNKTG
jgi:hypothetical protein